MGVLILPSRFTQQPQQAAPIDRSNPIAIGLAGAWIPPGIIAKAINGATVGRTSVGSGFLTSTTAYWQASASAVISQSPTWTILAMVYGAQAGVGNGFSLYCERPNATQLLKLQIGLGATSTANMVVRDSGGVGLVNISGTTDVRTMTGIRTIVGTRRALADHRLFVNGIQEGSSAVNPGSTFVDTPATLGYDMQDVTAALTTAALPIVLVWNRSLTDAEIAEVSRNPWQVFKAPPRRLWAITAGGTRSYSYTASGGVQLSGTALGVRAVTKTAAGGVLFSGAATRTKGVAKTPSGGLLLSGASTTLRGRAIAAIGGLSLSGAAGLLRGASRASLGGLKMGGAATVAFFSAIQTRIVNPVGGILLGGAASVARAARKASSGGFILSGASAVTSGAAGRFRALILVAGILRVIPAAQLGTGKKPIVYIAQRLRERLAAEGTPVILVNGRLRQLQPGETLDI